MRHPPPRRLRQRGTTLIEALVAFLVLSLGMLALARMQGQLRLNADLARQQSEAVRLAQQEMESMRAFGTAGAADPATGLRSFNAIVSHAHDIDAGTSYELAGDVSPAGVPHAKAVSIRVTWTDRSGVAHHYELHSVITGVDPALSGALTLLPP
jgi:Tfp pilus assembly protein PilV